MFSIREEYPTDITSVRTLHQLAFAGNAEAAIVDALVSTVITCSPLLP
jgi:predicted N-acetyltransferase YhbS